MDELRVDRGKVDAFIEECLRFHSPVFVLGRVCSRDVEVHGQHFQVGDKVLLGVGSANRDAKIFVDPNTFDIDRARVVEHLTFGVKSSPHYCIGCATGATRGQDTR